MNRDHKAFPWFIVILFVILKLLIHFFTNTNYDLHRDAFLYIAQGEHLAWGYISVPPLTAFLSKVFRTLFGESLFALRLLPAVIGGFTVIYLNLMVKEFGGKSWALILANTAYLLSLSYQRVNTLLQPVALDVFFWLVCCYYILRLVRSENPRYWIHLSIAFGLGFLNKYNIVFLAVPFFVSLLLTKDRILIRSINFLYALVIGFVLILPNLIWQYNHNWPVIYHMTLLSRYQLVHVSISNFMIGQFLMNLNGFITWMAGLGFLLFYKKMEPFRVLGFTWLGVIFIMLLAHGKHYYTLGIYPMLLAAGGYVFEQYIRERAWLYANLAFTLLINLPLLPIGLPLLKYDQMLSYCQKLMKIGIDMPMRWEDGLVHPLPQDYADMIGWKELSKIVENTYNQLPSEGKRYCYIYAENYGQAGAISFYGKKTGLPSPISFNGSFVFWAPEDLSDVEYFIYVNDEIHDLLPVFDEIKKVGEITNPYARETGLPVFLCSRPSDAFASLYNRRLNEEKSRFLRK